MLSDDRDAGNCGLAAAMEGSFLTAAGFDTAAACGYTPANLTPDTHMTSLPVLLGVVIIVKLLALILGQEPTPVGRQAHTS